MTLWKHATLILVAASMALTTAVAAPPAEQATRVTCASIVPTTGELAAWMSPSNLTAATNPGRARHATLSPGQAANIVLAPTPHVHFAQTPGKQGGPETFGGVLRLRIAQAGNYRIGLSNAAWIDLVSGGSAVASSMHGHGPDCSGIHKLVDFALQPGTYTLQIVASADPRVRLVAVRAQ